MNTTEINAALKREQSESLAQREHLARELEDIFAAVADVATDDEHDPEGSTIAYERSRSTALLEQVDAHLTEIEQAMKRLDGGDYGTCTECGEAIGSERLQARPTVQTCITCASQVA